MSEYRQASQPKQAGSRPRLWLLPLAAVTGVVAAWILVIALTPQKPRTVSEVRSEISQLVLRKSTRPNASDGGAIGPWWVSAQDGDAATGEFRGFQLRSGSLQVGAASARLVIDADLGEFSFDLAGVVLMRVPEDGAEDGDVVHLDRYMLGPAPLRGRIVHDEPAQRIVRARDY